MTVLLIGGPRDGQSIELEHETRFVEVLVSVIVDGLLVRGRYERASPGRYAWKGYRVKQSAEAA